MAQTQRTDPNEVEVTTEAIIEERNRIKASMLYHVLPALVQSRMPTLTSLRQSISSRQRHNKTRSVPEMPRPDTPPPGYTSRAESGSNTPEAHTSIAGGSVFEYTETLSEMAGGSHTATPSSITALYETSSGINWQYAMHGVSMTTQAHRQALDSATNDNNASVTILIRSLYVQGVSWLLRGLPTDLTADEALNLRAATPRNIIGSQNVCHVDALAPVAQAGATAPSEDVQAQSPALLHRTTAYLVFNFFLLLQFFLPYIRLLIAYAYNFEQEHRITRRVVDMSLTTANSLGRESLRFTQAVCRINNGMVGDAISDATLYCAKNITGGVQQGVEEAFRSQAWSRKIKAEER